MLVSDLAPLLTRFNLRLDLRGAPDDQIQLTIVPQKQEGSKLNGAVLAPISLTATAAELDAELAKGEDGALHRLVAARRSLADQIADQEAADAKAAADAKDKAAKAASKPATAPTKSGSNAATAPAKAASQAATAPAKSGAEGSVAAPTTPPADADPAKPSSLW